MARIMCYRCFWPAPLCWCGVLKPMQTRTRFLFLMHPKEYKREKAGTGRLTQLCLPHSSLHMGMDFEDHDAVREILSDERYYPVLLYPGAEALNLSHVNREESAQGQRFCALADELERKTLLVVLLDATWSSARKMLRLNPKLQALPRIMFTAAAPSRYVIKQQPQEGCLSTLEATHELLTVLEAAGLDHYDDPAHLLGIFGRMQDFQIRCASDPARQGYRHRSYTNVSARVPSRGRSATRRENYMRIPAAPTACP
jgi:DTW domain-containing protein